jgi:hypothetical protein
MLQGTKGQVGRPATTATPEEIKDCLNSVPKPRPYIPGVNDFTSWARRAARECGLSCNKYAPNGGTFLRRDTCFPAGTLVHTKLGLKEIQCVKPEDEGRSWNEKLGRFEYRAVTRTMSGTAYDIRVVRGADWSLASSLEHPFLLFNGSWRLAKELQLRDCVRAVDSDGASFLQVWTKRVAGGLEVFNFEVEGNHTYCVGEPGLVVHNRLM